MILILAVVLLSWGMIVFNGAGWSHPDDAAAAGALNWHRPLLTLTYQLNILIGGWMVANLLLHATASLLVFRLARQFTAARPSLIAACLFAAHPMAGDAAASVAGRSSLLCTVFMLACLSSFRLRWTACFAALAALTKEEAVVLLPLVPIVKWLRGDENHRPVAYASACVGFFIPLLADRVITSSVFGAPVDWFTTYFSAAGQTASLMFIPVGLSADPQWIVGIPHAVVGAIVVGALLSLKNVGAVLVAVPLLVYSLFPLADPLLEHRLYLPIAGASIMMGIVLAEYRRWQYAAAVCLFVLLANHRARVYSTPVRLWEDAIRPSDGRAGYRPLFNAGSARLFNGEPRLALDHWQRIKRPWDQRLRVNMAQAHLRLGDVASASRVLDDEATQIEDDGQRARRTRHQVLP